jgi:hypothetical protein
MRRWGVCALELALVMGLAATAGAVEPDDDAPPAAAKSTGNWFTRWFSSGKQAPAKKTAEQTPKADSAASNKMALREAAAAQRARDEADLLRRQGVCLKLRTIADQTNNDDLRRKADQLDEQAWNLYLRRTGDLAGGAGESLDEATLERHLGREPGRADAMPASASRGMNGQAAARGELP